MTASHSIWHQHWFDEDYLALYGHRDAAEAASLMDQLEHAHLLPPPHMRHLVMDLGCGAGRHAMELAKRGHAVIGLDWSAVLLREAMRQRGAEAWPQLVRGDLSRLPFAPNSARLVLSLFTSQGYHALDDANAQVWRSMLGLVQRGGVLVLDYLNPAWLMESLVPRSERQVGGLLVQESRHVDEEANQVVKDVHIRRPDGGTRHIREAVKLYEASWFLAHTQAFRLLHHWGDFQGRDWSATSPRSILILERQ